VLDAGQGAQKWAATQPLGAAGCSCSKLGHRVREVHPKLMVVDDRLLIVGSFNDTEPATTLNDENIVVIGDLEETDTAAEADQQQLAGFARAEINRIITDLAQPGPTAAVYAQETA
jgi:phosphatidylserine/phosphatidylglycerophosphate/cardiolipin synthase-like enzyme